MIIIALGSHIAKQVLGTVPEEANVAELVCFLARNTGLVCVAEIIISLGSMVDLNKVLEQSLLPGRTFLVIIDIMAGLRARHSLGIVLGTVLVAHFKTAADIISLVNGIVRFPVIVAVMNVEALSVHRGYRDSLNFEPTWRGEA